jgi:steroid delta-isomerase
MSTTRDLAIASLAALKAGDRQGWLDLYEDDALLENPVGPSQFDPLGKGRKGKEAIAGFWDTFRAQQDAFDFEIHRAKLCGNELAAYLTLHITQRGGQRVALEAIDIYRRSPNGKIASLRSFWEGA